MKTKLIHILIAIIAIFSLNSCKGTWLMYDVNQKNQIFFKDSRRINTASFAMLNTDENIEFTTKVFLMGMPSDEDKHFSIKALPCKEGEKIKIGELEYDVFSAEYDKDFVVENLVLPAGATEAEIKIVAKRNPQMLEGKYAKIHIQLVENEDFAILPFDDYSNSQILNSEFVLYITDGEPACPEWWTSNFNKPAGWNYNLGNFYPKKFRDFMTLFRATEKSCPSLYYLVVDKYGVNLDDLNLEKYGDPNKTEDSNKRSMYSLIFRGNYPNAWVKYVLDPLYQNYRKYYEEHPDDEHFELMGSQFVNQNGQIGWANPSDGRYGILN